MGKEIPTYALKETQEVCQNKPMRGPGQSTRNLH